MANPANTGAIPKKKKGKKSAASNPRQPGHKDVMKVLKYARDNHEYTSAEVVLWGSIGKETKEEIINTATKILTSPDNDEVDLEKTFTEAELEEFNMLGMLHESFKARWATFKNEQEKAGIKITVDQANEKRRALGETKRMLLQLC